MLVPQIQGTVRIVGETLHPTVLPYDPTWKLMDFVESSGGFTQNAKPSKIHVVDYNGKARSTKKEYYGLKGIQEFDLVAKL